MTNEELQRVDYRDRLLFVLSALDDLGEIMTQSKNISSIAKYFLRMMLGTVGISKGAIYCYDSQEECLHLESATLLYPESLGNLQLMLMDARNATRYTKPYYINDIPEKLAQIFKSWLLQWQNANTKILVVLAVHSTFLGVIGLGPCFMNRDYQKTDLEIIRLLARHISLSIYNRKLLSDTQQSISMLNQKVLELDQLHEIGLAITRLQSSDELLNDILTRAISILNARFGALWLLKNNGLHLAANFGFEPEKLPDILCSESAKTSSHCLNIPIQVRDKILGYLNVAGKESREGQFMPFTENDQQLLSAYANQAAVALENSMLHQDALEKERMDRELQIAAEIHRGLLPSEIPEVPGLEIAGEAIPCRTIGGDFYDVLPVSDTLYAVAIADVSGKSIPAAILVSTFHAALHLLKNQLNDLERVAFDLNELIYRATPENKFISACLMLWEPNTNSMRYVCGGHEPPFILKSDGSLIKLLPGGLTFGLFPSVTYHAASVFLEPDDLMCLYTDGITDIRNKADEFFGFDRFTDVCRKFRNLSASEIIHQINLAADEFREELPAPDDRTLIVIRKTK
ncbi:SpoIIE family protein phosphatase [bacterium]|nr:SpoIIE family protein phosphatase [candidate division CSSED10-310 bacterium]